MRRDQAPPAVFPPVHPNRPDPHTSGNTLDSVGVFVNTSGLAVGTYSESISIAAAGAGNTPLTVPVTLTVTLGNLFTTLYSANFYYLIGGAVQSLPNISIGSTGSALSYTVSAPSWLAVTPTSGRLPAASAFPSIRLA